MPKPGTPRIVFPDPKGGSALLEFVFLEERILIRLKGMHKWRSLPQDLAGALLTMHGKDEDA